MVKAALTVSANAREEVAVVLSVTWMVKVEAPAVVGEPLNTAPERVKPGGSVPDVSANVYGPMPPAATNVCEYAAPMEPVESGDGVVMVKPALTVNANAREDVLVALSATWTVKL
jgi:hypothetical protein